MKTIFFILSFILAAVQADNYKNPYSEYIEDASAGVGGIIGNKFGGAVGATVGAAIGKYGIKDVNNALERYVNEHSYDQNYIDEHGGFIYDKRDKTIYPTKDSQGYYINEQKIKNRYPNLRRE